jgi:hypothetical protein
MSTTEILRALRVGTRVRLRHDVWRYPHFIAPMGATGTVVGHEDSQPWTVAVRMDEHLDGAEDWDNEVHWYPTNGDDPLQDVEVLD